MTTLLLACFCLVQPGSGGIIATVAGTGQPGSGVEGQAATATALDQPFDVAVDARGDLYLADTMNHRVLRVDRTKRLVYAVAGDGHPGFSGDGGPARAARLNEPYGLCLDGRGNLYIVDRLNRRVRRVDGRTGVIETVAGDGEARSSGDGGPAVKAGLVEPNGVALADSGKSLLIADVAGCRVRKVDLASGLISTLAGTGRRRHDGDGGPAAAASVFGARAVDVGPDGSIYILEREGNRLRKVDHGTGLIRTIAGTGEKGYSGDGGPAVKATLDGPKELAVSSSGDVYVVDTENHAIRRVDARTGIITTVAGTGRSGPSGDGGPAAGASLDRPHGVAVQADGGILIGDTNNHRVRLVTPGLTTR